VQNVQNYAGYVLHTGYIKYGTLSVGDEVISEYDEVSIRPLGMFQLLTIRSCVETLSRTITQAHMS